MLGKMTAVLTAAMLSLVAAAVSAQAQSEGQAAQPQQQQSQPQQQEMVLIASFDCNSAIRPDQTTICSAPQLAAMDIQMSTLLTVVQQFVGPSEAGDLRATQQVFVSDRANCGTDYRCIGNAYVQRITELGDIVNQAAAALERLRGESEQQSN